jgi:hypothetical protein
MIVIIVSTQSELDCLSTMTLGAADLILVGGKLVKSVFNIQGLE